MIEKWWQNSVVYQIYVKSFYDSNGDGIGDIKGVIKKLDYLKYLGIDVIWLNPVYSSPMVDNGYDISDYYSIDKQFGNIKDIELLISEAKKRDIRILMDLVINHTSDKNSWFIESKSSVNNDKRDWYIWRKGSNGKDFPNGVKSTFGGSAWEYDEKTDEFYLHVFAKEQPDLNWENESLRKELYKMINWWLDKGISGFRIDAITYIKKRQDILKSNDMNPVSASSVFLNQAGIEKFLSELKEKAFLKHDIMTVAESPGVKPSELIKYSGTSGYFSMLFFFQHVDLDINEDGKWYIPKKWTLLEFKSQIQKVQNILNTGGWCGNFIENHDLPRSLNRYINKSDIGEIPAKMLAIIYMFLKGTPFIYQGQEIGMTNNEDFSIDDYDDIASVNQYNSALKEGFSKEEALDALHRRSRDNSRTPMQWKNEDNAGFTKAKPWLKVNKNYKSINVEDEIRNKKSLLNYYKLIIDLRKSSEYSDVIKYGDYESVLPESKEIVAYKRKYKGKCLLVVANFFENKVHCSFDYKVRKIVLSNYGIKIADIKDLRLHPYEAMVFDISVK